MCRTNIQVASGEGAVTPEQAYFAQFSGEVADDTFVIRTDADMQAFNEMYRQKWRTEHAEIIREWQRIKTEQCQK